MLNVQGPPGVGKTVSYAFSSKLVKCLTKMISLQLRPLRKKPAGLS